jgi:hypothetical protein
MPYLTGDSMQSLGHLYEIFMLAPIYSKKNEHWPCPQNAYLLTCRFEEISSPWSSWRWECGNRRSDFQGLWDGWENGFIVFPGIPQTVISTAFFQSVDLQAATVVVASFQSCSNLIGLT